MSKIISPSVGRKVWFRLNGITELEKPRSGAEMVPDRSFPQVIDMAKPLDATVVHVWNDRMVNLHVLDHYGNPFIATSVTLLQEGDTPPQFGFYAEWMPYQVGQAKGLTAPRVTPADIEANIASEHYFTANDGRQGAISAGLYVGREVAADDDVDLAPLGLLTFCVIVLRNGFTVTGESACASPENFDAEVGRKIARQNAVAKIWPLMGYELRSKLAKWG